MPQSLQTPLVMSHDPQGSGSLSHAEPPGLHCCGTLPMQRRVPGWHAPPQTPPEQMFEHVVPEAGQLPFAPQVSD